MIELYSANTSNGRKITIMLEECELSYEEHPVDLDKDEQLDPAFMKMSPSGKIPAIVDTDGPNGEPYAVFESGAILMYLAEKSGRFMPADVGGRFEVIQWLMFQMGGVGPIFGQVHHFRRAAPEFVPYAVERFDRQCRRLYRVLDRRLESQQYLAGALSIADFAVVPWVYRHPWQEVELSEYPHVLRWFESLMSRPALVRGMRLSA